MGFAENFNYCLDSREYSAYRFAKIIGANIQTVINWKNGVSKPHYNTRQKIADHFGITMAELDGNELPVLPPEGAKREIASGINAEGEGWTDMQKDAVNFVLSLPPERLEMFIKMGKAAFEEESHD